MSSSFDPSSLPTSSCLPSPRPHGYSHRSHPRIVLAPLEGVYPLGSPRRRTSLASDLARWKEVHLGTRVETAKSHCRRSFPPYLPLSELISPFVLLQW